MAPPSLVITHPAAPARPHNRLFLLLAVVGVLLPLLGYVVLPAFGIGVFNQVLDMKRLTLLCMAVIGAAVGLNYLKFVVPRPQLLVAFIILAWPIVDYLNSQLLNTVGINIHLRPLLILAVALPALWLSVRHGRMLWQQLPWLKYYIFFFLWLVLYAVFYNANAVDPRLTGGDEATAEASVSMVQLSAYFYCLMGMTVGGIAILKAKNPRALFDTLNRALLWVSGLESIVTIIGYPFGLFNIVLDGFTRAVGIFSHPNPFAHHMGVLMIYLLGLFCYYQGNRQHRMPGWLLMSGIGLNLVAFLLGLSKTALAVFALCATLLFVLNLAVPAVRRGFFRMLLIAAVLIPIGFFGFQALSGESFFSLLESRIDQTQSLTWRTLVWQDLLADIQGSAMLFGHGYTSANATIFRLTFNDAKNAQPLMMVHNAYIALIYDLGVMGYLMFVSAGSLVWQAVRGWLQAVRPAMRTEYSIILALTLYFLCVCGFDEMSYMFDAPMLFWTLSTMLYCMSVRERQALAKEGTV